MTDIGLQIQYSHEQIYKHKLQIRYITHYTEGRNEIPETHAISGLLSGDPIFESTKTNLVLVMYIFCQFACFLCCLGLHILA